MQTGSVTAVTDADREGEVQMAGEEIHGTISIISNIYIQGIFIGMCRYDV